ncbi:MAG: hypothetical protein NXY57DRAFT_969947 [Lentinula lateritia]|nr:MAG: hypothetical protein NXY57DRAFT_969947 [Lentinula lateritia]
MTISINPLTSTLITPALMISVTYIPIPHPQPQTLMSLSTRSLPRLPKRRNSGPVMTDLVILTSDPMAGLWTPRGKGTECLGCAFIARTGENYDADDSELDIPGSDDGSE